MIRTNNDDGSLTLEGKIITLFTILQVGWTPFSSVENTIAMLLGVSIDDIYESFRKLEEGGFKFKRVNEDGSQNQEITH